MDALLRIPIIPLKNKAFVGTIPVLSYACQVKRYFHHEVTKKSKKKYAPLRLKGTEKNKICLLQPPRDKPLV
ncbi:MAG: hypothetical protein Phog2KO_18460 [Phototrophicaceae bacterium]